ncbi:MAG: hypothetical protein QM527_11585 [Alphaproteobacteria bacterium]|nr:hypothetical protein [Alphaproteobacteria bacterium]
MAIDPSKFHLINVADTCSVWNVLSSARLHAAAKEAHCEFCVTSFVRYECLTKPRKASTPAETELMQRLTQEQARGGFAAHSCDIGDLQAIKLLESRKKLGKGELSSIAFAMKINQAVITDDKKARTGGNSSLRSLQKLSLSSARQEAARFDSLAATSGAGPWLDSSSYIAILSKEQRNRVGGLIS